ncbi:hypothetical protein [Spongiactinospora sp. TRM90649]|uniref:hypothetical protein n=1 Tax=Spongiactinospora sp. TRM90649 TaxID=3031114 RepID=UPI0023F9943E|nr:hypothetical protein [Spongiactinospora sp. TRM90649]MDF5754516.1 hypothetical protein [Spongiactinospora sp. TRM90649]
MRVDEDEARAVHSPAAPVRLSPGLFVSERFGERAAQVVHDVLTAHDGGGLSPRDGRPPNLDVAKARAAAYDAVTGLGVITREDFLGLRLDLGDRLTCKIYNSLVAAGHLRPDGALVADRLPAVPAGLRLSRDFGAYRDALFTLVRDLNAGREPDPGEAAEPAWFYPSDLARLAGLNAAERAELYENLVFRGYIDASGEVLRPEFFADPANAARFAVNAGIDDVLPEVLSLLRAGLRDSQCAFTTADFEVIADRAVARRVAGLLEGPCTVGGRVREELRAAFARAETSLGLDEGFTEADRSAVAARVASILAEEDPYRFDLGALAALGLGEAESTRLVGALTGAGHLTDSLAVPLDRLAFFTGPAGATGLTLPGLEEHASQVHALLRSAATELAAATTEIVAVLTALNGER